MLVVITLLSLAPHFVLIIQEVRDVLCSLDELSSGLSLPYV